MITYKYKARSNDGTDVSGIVQAADEFQAAEQIREDYPIILELSAVKEKGKHGIWDMEIGGQKKWDVKSLSIACSQIAITLSSGIPVSRALELIGKQTEDKRVRKLLLDTADDVSSGNTLSSSLQRNGGNLPATFLETIRAGEETGNLEHSFDSMAKYYDKQNKTRQKIKQALNYPIFVICVAIVVLIVVMVVVIPSLSSTFASLGADLPAMTRAMIAMSNFFAKWWPLIAIIVVAAVLGWKFYVKTDKGKITQGKVQLHMPIIGRINVMNCSSEFASTMSLMMAAGITVNRSLEITARTLDNYILQQETASIVGYVEEGVPLGKAMEQHCPDFPDTLKEMTGIGEETGELESTLKVIGDFYANEADNATKQAIAKLDPIILIFLAIFAGFIVISIYLPMFTMYNYM